MFSINKIKSLGVWFMGISMLFLWSNAGIADLISTNIDNKEIKVSGKVIDLKNGKVSLLGDDGNITDINWNNINSLIISDRVFVTFTTDERIFGSLKLENGKILINSASMGVIKSTPNNVIAIERKKREISPGLNISPREMAVIRGKGQLPSPPAETRQEDRTTAPTKASESVKNLTTIGERGEKRPEETFVRADKVVLPKGKLETELNVSYYDNSPLGLLGSRDRTLIFPLTARYGITNKLLGLVTVPLAIGWREIPGETKTKTHAASGLADISFGLQYQILTERVVRPDLMFFLLASSNTGKGGYQLPTTQTPLGTGFWQINPGLSFVKTVDPVVIFGSLSYTHFFEKSGFQPGEAINPVLGTGFAVNDEVAISFKLAGSCITRARYRGEEFGRVLTPFSFYFALDKYITNKSYLEPSVGIGLTTDAPDFSFGLSYVHRWF
ncbi:MAG: transporter [Deltaproteobacteria bacterium]|nr:transporter [Deltaproteobacteria bacterium]